MNICERPLWVRQGAFYFSSLSPVLCPFSLNVEMERWRLPPESQARVTRQDPLSLCQSQTTGAPASNPEASSPSAAQRAGSRKNSRTHGSSLTLTGQVTKGCFERPGPEKPCGQSPHPALGSTAPSPRTRISKA